MNTMSRIVVVLFLFSGSGITRAGEEQKATITFHRDIAPIMFAQCSVCHREGEVAPFPLLSYEDAAKRAKWIAENVSERRMPPWRASPGYGHFVGERRLSEEDIALFRDWAEAGAPEGDPKDAPPMPVYGSGWSLDEPDIVLEAPHEVSVPPDGPDIFHHFVVSAGGAVGHEISAVEFRPGNPRVVHHAVILLDESGSARAKDDATPEPGYVTGGGTGTPLAGILNVWAPGVTTHRLPADVSLELPSNGDVVVQLHLHPSGKVETDRSRIGIYFAKKPASRHIMNRPFVFGPVALDIPAGAKRHPVSASMELPVNLWLTAILPHMHLLGKQMTVYAILPNGNKQPLIKIEDWDFNWQDQYVYAEPVYLPKGSIVHVEAMYDNSEDNPANPRTPPQRVLFGEETSEEMCLALFQVIAEHPDDANRIRNAVFSNIFAQLFDPKVDPLVVRSLMGQVREFAGPELKGLIKEQFTTLLTK